MNAKVDIFPVLEAWDRLRLTILSVLSSQPQTMSERAEALEEGQKDFGAFLTTHVRGSDMEARAPLKRVHDFMRAHAARDSGLPDDVILPIMADGAHFVLRMSDLVQLLGEPPALPPPLPPPAPIKPKRKPSNNSKK